MKAEDLKTPDDIERYIEGCLNDFENGISTKSETTAHLGEMAVQIYKQTLKESAQLSQQPSNDTHTDHFVEVNKKVKPTKQRDMRKTAMQILIDRLNNDIKSHPLIKGYIQVVIDHAEELKVNEERQQIFEAHYDGMGNKNSGRSIESETYYTENYEA